MPVHNSEVGFSCMIVSMGKEYGKVRSLPVDALTTFFFKRATYAFDNIIPSQCTALAVEILLMAVLPHTISDLESSLKKVSAHSRFDTSRNHSSDTHTQRGRQIRSG